MSGICVLVIRGDDSFSAILREAGHQIINLELIETKVIDDLAELGSKLASNTYDGLFFTSPVAAQAFLKIRAELNGFRAKAYVLGKRSREVLSDSSLELCYIDKANTAGEMINGFGVGEFSGKRFLFVRGDRSLRTIPEKLNGVAAVDEVVVYMTKTRGIAEGLKSDIGARLSRGEIGWTCFFSPSSVEEYITHFGETARTAAVAAVGSTTADAARRVGLAVEFVSPTAKTETFARALVKYITKGE